MQRRESKWHEELGTTFSTNFWTKTYQSLLSIKNDNRLKWLQFQIVRNCQYTNVRVNKFKPQISPLCTYCKTETEVISHLYFRCPITFAFLRQTKEYFQELGVTIILNEHNILFGNKNETPESIDNQILLWIKSFIWANKFKNSFLSLSVFLEVFKQRLREVKEMSDIDARSYKHFVKWIPIYNKLNLQNGGNWCWRSGR